MLSCFSSGHGLIRSILGEALLLPPTTSTTLIYLPSPGTSLLHSLLFLLQPVNQNLVPDFKGTVSHMIFLEHPHPAEQKAGRTIFTECFEVQLFHLDTYPASSHSSAKLTDLVSGYHHNPVFLLFDCTFSCSHFRAPPQPQSAISTQHFQVFIHLSAEIHVCLLSQQGATLRRGSLLLSFFLHFLILPHCTYEQRHHKLHCKTL